ncbi:MAG: hypothetical protein ACYDBZ_17890 [Steroidobacteraceae bacterium]
MAVIGQRWLGMERAMGIEPTTQAWEAIAVCLTPINQHVASRCLPFIATDQSRKDVHYFVTERDLSLMLSGLKPSNKVRTVFVGKGGKALVTRDLYVDDPAAVEQFFKTQTLPDVFTDIATTVTVATPASGCDPSQRSP